MANVLQDRRSRFFVLMAALFVCAALAGFTKTFFLPIWQESFKATPVFFIHGGFFFAWVMLFATQIFLIRIKKPALHRAMGLLAVAIVIGMVVSCIGVGIGAMHRDLALGLGQIARSALMGVFTSMVIFTSLFIAGIVYRRRPDYHKRLMFLATVFVLWPAWFRFRHYFPDVPRPDIVFGVVLADTPIVIAMIYDLLTIKRVHPVYLYVGSALILENFVEVLVFDSPVWQTAANWLASFFI